MMNAQNDLCSNAVNLTPSITCTSTSGTFNSAQLDGNNSTCASNASQDVWFKFTATDPTMYVEVSNSINIGLDVAMEIYSDDCNGTLVVCRNNTTATQGYEGYFNTNFVVGQTYYVRVLNVSSTISTQNFSICVQKYPTPINDLCANATTLTPGVSCTTTGGTFSGAYFDGNSSSCAPNASQDVWFKFTATDPTMYVEVSNSINIGLDVAMEIYSGDCNGTLVTCKNEATATQGYEGYFNTNFVVGQIYYVRVLNVSSTISTQNFSICVQKYPTPTNDLCENATTLTPGVSCTTTGGTFSGAYFDGNSSSCSPNASQDVWFKFTATDPTMYVEVSNSINIGLDVAIEIYSGNCNGTLVTCKNETTATQGYEGYFNNNFVVGQIYYIRVLNVSPNISIRNFSICVQKYLTPTNDLCENATILTHSTNCITTPGTFAGSSISSTAPSCSSNSSQDVWYKFVANNTSLSISISNSINIGLDLGMEIISTDCSGTQIACINQGGTTSGGEFYSFSNFVVGNTYYVRVFNVSSNLSVRNFSICIQGAVLDTNSFERNNVTIAPNPVKDVFKISNLDSVTNYSYQIINTQGQLIDQGKLSQDTINTIHMKQGVYILRLFDGTKEMVTKFIKE
jgi:energy-converting hydrogenase Eha subunit B